MRFVAGLVEAVKIFLFKQHLELFLHLRKPVDTPIPMPEYLFRSDEMVEPDSFENIAVNRSKGIGLLQFALWFNKKCVLHGNTFSVYRSGTTATTNRNICSSPMVP